MERELIFKDYIKNGDCVVTVDVEPAEPLTRNGPGSPRLVTLTDVNFRIGKDAPPWDKIEINELNCLKFSTRRYIVESIDPDFYEYIEEGVDNQEQAEVEAEALKQAVINYKKLEGINHESV